MDYFMTDILHNFLVYFVLNTELIPFRLKDDVEFVLLAKELWPRVYRFIGYYLGLYYGYLLSISKLIAF